MRFDEQAFTVGGVGQTAAGCNLAVYVGRGLEGTERSLGVDGQAGDSSG